MPSRGFFSELRRRNVFRVAIAYLVLSWLLIQVADVMFPALNLPEWSITFVIALLIIGFIPALIFSWVYELTPDGLKRESDVDPKQSITPETGHRLNLITIGLLLVGICVVFIDHFFLDRSDQVATPVAGDTSSETAPLLKASQDESVPFLAVLPFRASGSDDGGVLANGLHDDLLTRLAKLGAFKVISRTSMMEYKDTTKNMRQISDELGAGYILEGAVQALGDRVRINAQLIDARHDRHLWAESYDRELTAANLFEVQADLALAIAVQLKTTLSDFAKASISDIPTYNTEAYKAYLKGLEIEARTHYDSIHSDEIEAFTEAVRLDPNLAIAWAHLSRAHGRKASHATESTARQEQLQASLNALNKAQLLEPDLLETKLAFVEHLEIMSLFEKAGEPVAQSQLEELILALESLSNEYTHNFEVIKRKGRVLWDIGELQEGYQLLLEAQSLAPRNLSIVYSLSMYSIRMRDCASAEWHINSGLSLDPEDAEFLSLAVLNEIECTGNTARARKLLQGVDYSDASRGYIARLAARADRDFNWLLELSREPIKWGDLTLPIWDLFDQCEALRYLGRLEEADSVLDKAKVLIEQLEAGGKIQTENWYLLTKALYAALKGDEEETAKWIAKEKNQLELKTARYAHVMEATDRLLDRTRVLAEANLLGDTVEELEALLAMPFGHTFILIDSMPWFDDLKNRPDYENLRRRYGSSN